MAGWGAWVQGRRVTTSAFLWSHKPSGDSSASPAFNQWVGKPTLESTPSPVDRIGAILVSQARARDAKRMRQEENVERVCRVRGVTRVFLMALQPSGEDGRCNGVRGVTIVPAF